MAFKSYSWVIGTTSFRVSQLNYKIERQLELLKQFWNINPSLSWNNSTQEKFYDFLKSNNFIQGDAPRKDKDAREITSGLVDIGVLDSSRKLTEVGSKIEGLLNKERIKNNIFYIDDDSYDYLLQFLKLQIDESGIKIKPFIALIYMLEKLEYLTYDEFTYLLPLCKNKYDVRKMVENIKANRNGFDIDNIIVDKIYDMDNYLQALEYFRKDYPVTEKTFETIGMNRKSVAYDHPYLNVYNELVNLVFHLRHNSFEERKNSYTKLYDYTEKIFGNAKALWMNYLFMNYSKKNINEEFDVKFKDLEISTVKNIIDFKIAFFERLHIIKWKVNLKEYFDLNKRYFSLTDIVKFNDEKVQLDMLPKYYFENIIDDLLDESIIEDNEKYNKIFESYLPINGISNKYTIDINQIIAKINKQLNTNLSISNINTYLENEKIKDFNKLIDEKFDDNTIVRLLSQIKARDDIEVISYVTDNADVPTIFEYILGIVWYKISGRTGNILKYMNLSLDANLLPKTHAGGGMADIVYEYDDTDKFPKHNLLIEATISESTGQRHMEMEPVSRHLGEDINKTNNKNDYALFIAPNLEERVILDFRNMRTRFYPKTNGEYINGLKIIPIDSDLIIKIISKNKKYDYLYDVFDKAYNSTIPDPNWFEKEIVEKL
jgi:hypothetical protein